MTDFHEDEGFQSRSPSMTLEGDIDDLTVDDDDDEIIELSGTEVLKLKAQQRSLEQLAGGKVKYYQQKEIENGEIIRPRMSVECFDGTFFYIYRIAEFPAKTESQTDVNLIGYRIVRNKDFDRGSASYGPLPCKPNELYLDLQVKLGVSTTFGSLDSMTAIPSSAAVCVREVTFTNTSYPLHRTKSSLVCRRKYIQESTISNQKKRTNTCRIENLTETEVHPSKSTSDVSKSRRSRLLETVTSNPSPRKRQHDEIGRTNSEHSNQRQSSVEMAECLERQGFVECTNQYTFGDVFCGGGLVTFAAKKAGLMSEWALDRDESACSTMEKNHQETRLFALDVSDFISMLKADAELQSRLQVDVLHVSSPCQGLSMMNRGQNPENDAINNALGLVVGEIIQLLKPRRVTMEQTNGIRSKDRGDWLYRAIHQLTEHEYSVAWSTMQSTQYGDAVNRKRMIILSSCPGETLPAFPSQTHGSDPGLKPFVTVGERLRMIRLTDYDIEQHNVPEERRKFRESKRGDLPVSNKNAPLSKTIMTSGSRELHWSGNRRYTELEDKVIMGLSTLYQIMGDGSGKRRRQVGNGVTIGLFSEIMRSIIQGLKDDDIVAKNYTPKVFTIDD